MTATVIDLATERRRRRTVAHCLNCRTDLRHGETCDCGHLTIPPDGAA